MNQNQFSDTILYQTVFPSESVIQSTHDSVNGEISETNSFFTEQALPPESFVKKHRFLSKGIEPFWILMASLLIVAFLNLVFHKYYKYKIMGFFYSKFKSLNIEKEERNKQLSRILSLIFYFNFALLLYVSIPLLGFSIPDFYGLDLYWIVVLFIVFFSILKSVIYLVSSLLFTNFEQGWELLRINNESQWVATLTLLPLNFLLIYASYSIWMFYLIASILAVIFIIKQVKLYSKIRGTTSYYNYQIILYLCGLEILPLLVMFRYLV